MGNSNLKRQKRVQRPFCGNPRNRHQSKLSILIVYQISQNMSENKRPADGENGANGATDTKKPKSEIPSGILLFTGATDWDDVGRKTNILPRSNNTIWSPVRLDALEDVQIESVSSGASAVHQFAVSNEGKVYAWGRNEKGQLGLNDLKDRKCPTLVEDLTGYRVVSTSCGKEFSGLVDVQGNVYMFGSPDNGQCGNNTDGKFLERAGKESYIYVDEPTKVTLFVEKDPKTKKSTPIRGVYVKEIACGNTHTVIIDDRNRAFSWGFGGYGRLGHSDTSTELVPRLIKFLDGPKRGIRKIVCGGNFNLAMSEIPGTVYMWGQYNSSKEANMYPKPIADLSGWNVRSFACGTKGWMLAADESVIGCCPSPGFGELGMGEYKKSSAQPLEITKLDGVHVLAVGCGVAHSVFIGRNETDEDKKALDKYKILDQSDLD